MLAIDVGLMIFLFVRALCDRRAADAGLSTSGLNPAAGRSSAHKIAGEGGCAHDISGIVPCGDIAKWPVDVPENSACVIKRRNTFKSVRQLLNFLVVNSRFDGFVRRDKSGWRVRWNFRKNLRRFAHALSPFPCGLGLTKSELGGI